MISLNGRNAKETHVFLRGSALPGVFIQCLIWAMDLGYSRKLWIFGTSTFHSRRKSTICQANWLQKGANEKASDSFSLAVSAFGLVGSRGAARDFCSPAGGVESGDEQNIYRTHDFDFDHSGWR